MRLLYLTYGPQSGVIRFLGEALGRLGVAVTVFNAAEGVDYRMKRYKLPSPHPANLANTALSLWRYGREWRWHFRRTDLAFRRMSRNAQAHIESRQGEFDGVLQSGALFDGCLRSRRIPAALYIDHTYAISKAYAPLSGLPGSAPASPRWEEWERDIYQEADRVFSMSQFVKRSLMETYGVDSEKISVVGAGPNLDPLPSPVEAQVPARRFLFVGKDFLRKGGPDLLEAYARLREEYPDASLTVVGPPVGPDRAGVAWKPNLSHAEMRKEFESADAFVLPTLREPFGLAFLEAMAYGLPCIGTRVEAIPEIIEEGRTGLLVPPGDVEALHEALRTLAGDGGDAAGLGAAGRNRVMSEFTWDHVARQIAGELFR